MVMLMNIVFNTLKFLCFATYSQVVQRNWMEILKKRKKRKLEFPTLPNEEPPVVCRWRSSAEAGFDYYITVTTRCLLALTPAKVDSEKGSLMEGLNKT